jgi:hypothetical protein
MPDELTFELRELDLRFIDVAADAWTPVIVDPGERFAQIHGA